MSKWCITWALYLYLCWLFIFLTFNDELTTTKLHWWYTSTTSRCNYWYIFSSLWWCNAFCAASSSTSSQGDFNHLPHQHHKLMLSTMCDAAGIKGIKGALLDKYHPPLLSLCPETTLLNTQRGLFSQMKSSLSLVDYGVCRWCTFWVYGNHAGEGAMSPQCLVKCYVGM